MALEDQSAAKSTVKVNCLNDSKGYGFITSDKGGDELFVHQSFIISEGFRSLTIGDSVELAITQGRDRKTKAVDVTALGGAPLNKKEISSRGKGTGQGGCYNCGETGHLAKDCHDGAAATVAPVEQCPDETCSESDGEEEPNKCLSLRIEKLPKGVIVGSALQSWMGDGFPVHGGDVYHAINRLRKLGRNKCALDVSNSLLASL